MKKEQIVAKANKVLSPLDTYSHQCHAASIALVKAGIGDRVARGWVSGVAGQHSWVVFGDPYKPELIVDPTLWSYRDDVEGIYVGDDKTFRHVPHGSGSIFEWGRPSPAVGQVIELTPSAPLSKDAQWFLELLGPLDREGWHTLLAKAPVGDWPAGEIIAAADDTPEIAAYIPIDRLGMLTDRNPSGLYMRGKEK